MKKPYVPDIRAFGSLCEINYRRFFKLFPGLESRQPLSVPDRVTLDLRRDDREPVHLGEITARLEQMGPYTHTVYLRQVSSGGRWLNDPRFEVRLYHDARMAEVVKVGSIRVADGFHEYPNHKMHLPDEKHQLNRFLAEWLQFCLLHRVQADHGNGAKAGY